MPRSDAVLREDRPRVLVLRSPGVSGHGEDADGHSRELPDHDQLPRLPPDRRQARRRVDRRRSPLLQRPRRPIRLREDQPPAGLPAAHGAPGARLRAVSPHRLRPVPRRAPAAVREGVQRSGAGELRSDRAAEGRQRDHEQRGGGPRWWIERRRAHGPVVRAVRLRLAARPGLPDADRGSRGLCGADDRIGEHHARRSNVHASRRRVFREGDGGRARREAEAAGTGAARYEHRS